MNALFNIFKLRFQKAYLQNIHLSIQLLTLNVDFFPK